MYTIIDITLYSNTIHIAFNTHNYNGIISTKTKYIIKGSISNKVCYHMENIEIVKQIIRIF